MGLRGPPPKPTVLKLVPGGNPGRRKPDAAEPVPPPGKPEPPEPLDERARKVWDALVPRLTMVGLARSIDGIALARYCSLLVVWLDAARALRESGTKYAIRDKPVNGRPGRVLSLRVSPDVGVVSRLHRDLLAIEREFGLTPAARTRIRTQADGAAKGDVNELKRNFFASGA